MDKWSIQYKNYHGGINNLCIVESDGIITTSIKGKEQALKNHCKKILNKAKEDYKRDLDFDYMAHIDIK